MYDYRKMTAKQRREVVEYRRKQSRPWHSPPHWHFAGERQFIISAACFNHTPVVGTSLTRMTECEKSLLEVCEKCSTVVFAWCVLPNHYHLLVQTTRPEELRRELGKFHGKSSFLWNGEDECRGRQVWYRCFDRDIKSEGHFWASVNYLHHNPVKHGYVEKWQDWIWSSAKGFLERMGRERAIEIWHHYPILEYGKKWDVEPL